MDETLGKRIVANRKRIGLTQDQLAERLGVTAQAVSKWENDQSCPDIAMLPKLSEIFGITTDALLGRESTAPVHEAQIVEDEDNHNGHGVWEFHWDGGRKEGLTLAVLVLLVGVLTLLSKVLEWNAGFWSILWPSALLVYGIRGLFSRFSFFSIGCALFGGYFLIDNLNIWELDIGDELIFPIIIVIFGVSLLVDALRKPQKPKFTISHNGVKLNDGKKTHSNFETGVDSFESELSFGQNTHPVVLPLLRNGEASCSFGELTVDLTGCRQVADDCEIEVNCSFGELELLVPRRFLVNLDRSASFGSIDISGQPDDQPQGVIALEANVSFGQIQIRYI